MAYSSPVIQNAFHLVSSGNLRFVSYPWPETLLNGAYDLEARLTINGLEFAGRGTAFGEELALIKATSEALERAWILGAGHANSNGIAVHVSPDLAIETAFNELIERDSLAAHLMAGAPFYELADSNIVDGRLRGLAQHFYREGISLNFFELKRQSSVLVSIAVADGRCANSPFGIIVGMGAARSLNEAVTKAGFECVRNVFAFKDAAKPGSINRARAIEIDYANDFCSKFLPAHPPQVNTHGETEAHSFEKYTALLKISDIHLSDLYVARVMSRNHFVLKNDSVMLPDAVIQKRLSDLFSGILYEPFNRLHPLG